MGDHYYKIILIDIIIQLHPALQISVYGSDPVRFTKWFDKEISPKSWTFTDCFGRRGMSTTRCDGSKQSVKVHVLAGYSLARQCVRQLANVTVVAVYTRGS